MEKEKGGRAKMVTAVKPISPTIVEFDTKEDMDRFIRNEVKRKKVPSDRMNALMKRHIEQRKK